MALNISGKVIIFFVLDPCKFFGCELGAQTQFDFKNERYIVNGSHEASKLQVIILPSSLIIIYIMGGGYLFYISICCQQRNLKYGNNHDIHK